MIGIDVAQRLTATFLLACGISVLGGCSDGLARVAGTITFKGDPVSRGMISLEPIDGKGPSSGANVENGKFSIDGVLPGPKEVRIRAVKVIGKKKLDDDIPDSPLIDLVEELLPKRYNETTELKLDVVAPSTVHDFKLEAE